MVGNIFSLSLISVICFIIPSTYAAETFRLPNNTRPETYLINLEFNDFESNLRFTGESFIKIYVVEETNTITLHNAVNIESVVLCTSLNSNCDKIEIVNTSVDVEREFFHITTAQNLMADNSYYLNFKFNGTIFTMTSNFFGVYRGSFLIDGVRE